MSASPRSPLPARLTALASTLVLAGLAGCVADPSASSADGTTASASSRAAAAVELPALALPTAARSAAAASSEASAARRPRPSDPLFAAVLGHWKGECDIFLPGVDEPAFSVGVERISERTADPDEITWTLIYRNGTTPDQRNYSMRRDPTQPGRYVLDEHNGILLTNYMHGDDLMINDFEGLGFRLRGREEYKNGRYDFEFVTSEVVPEITSPLGDVEFYAYRVLSTQRCTMRRHGRH